jgi:hypothetical protein
LGTFHEKTLEGLQREGRTAAPISPRHDAAGSQILADQEVQTLGDRAITRTAGHLAARIVAQADLGNL